MAKELIIGFTDTIPPIANFFTTVLSTKYDVVRDDENPKYLIFGDTNFGMNNLSPKYDRSDITRIFYTGENQRPWDYKCDYALTFDHFDNDRHYRLPLYVIYDFDNKLKGVQTVDDCEAGQDRSFTDLVAPRKFCSFIVKNGGCQKRNDFFHLLSTYKQVDSAGPLFNNMGQILDREKAVESKLAFLPKYKFNLCFENASYPGYATEKLYEALIGKTIPIYWGSPTIEVDFNPNAFINWHDYQDDKKLFDRIVELDNDPEYYTEMYLEPMFANFKRNKFFDQERLLNWWDKNVVK